MPTQLRYLASFLDMYVFPRAGNPTIHITVGAFTTPALTTGKYKFRDFSEKDKQFGDDTTLP
jgi:hypothetical protein